MGRNVMTGPRLRQDLRCNEVVKSPATSAQWIGATDAAAVAIASTVNTALPIDAAVAVALYLPGADPTVKVARARPLTSVVSPVAVTLPPAPLVQVTRNP